MSKYSVLIVGMGKRGMHHATAFNANPRFQVIGICDTPEGLGRRIAAALDLQPASVSLDYVGLNHLGWMRAVLGRFFGG